MHCTLLPAAKHLARGLTQIPIREPPGHLPLEGTEDGLGLSTVIISSNLPSRHSILTREISAAQDLLHALYLTTRCQAPRTRSHPDSHPRASWPPSPGRTEDGLGPSTVIISSNLPSRHSILTREISAAQDLLHAPYLTTRCQAPRTRSHPDTHPRASWPPSPGRTEDGLGPSTVIISSNLPSRHSILTREISAAQDLLHALYLTTRCQAPRTRSHPDPHPRASWPPSPGRTEDGLGPSTVIISSNRPSRRSILTREISAAQDLLHALYLTTRCQAPRTRSHPDPHPRASWPPSPGRTEDGLGPSTVIISSNRPSRCSILTREISAAQDLLHAPYLTTRCQAPRTRSHPDPHPRASWPPSPGRTEDGLGPSTVIISSNRPSRCSILTREISAAQDLLHAPYLTTRWQAPRTRSHPDSHLRASWPPSPGRTEDGLGPSTVIISSNLPSRHSILTREISAAQDLLHAPYLTTRCQAPRTRSHPDPHPRASWPPSPGRTEDGLGPSTVIISSNLPSRRSILSREISAAQDLLLCEPRSNRANKPGLNCMFFKRCIVLVN
ncbi:hypothetical protein NDU88_000005 [Pleurodeles waltl]|uniref:Uncharacterized protein n=1 Tax=Pleurodeles waltl TaxID=8319 RepID=A0AAV7M443_PLEWA|nr:hypothetical protein NDU88_000005 [Pleurodeles waltl]